MQEDDLLWRLLKEAGEKRRRRPIYNIYIFKLIKKICIMVYFKSDLILIIIY